MMKKFLLIALTVILSLSAFACTPKEEGCKHEFGQTQAFYTIKESGDNEEIYSAKICTVCDQTVMQEKVNGQIVSKQTEASSKIQAANTGDVVYFKKSAYKEIRLFKALDGITFYGEDGSTINKISFESENGCKNVTIKNFTFDTYDYGGIIFNCAVDGISIIDCSFNWCVHIADKDGSTPPQLKNLTIKDCKFKTIYRSPNARLSALRLQKVENFTISGCEFDDVEFNAMQLGNTALTGIVKIEGNTFKNIGSRVIRLVKNQSASCDIVSNTFYDNTDLENSDGIYIHCGGGNCKLGANTWENMPSFNEQEFLGVNKGYLTFDMAEQKLLG